VRTTTTQQAHTRTAATNPTTTTVPAGAGATSAGWTVFEGPAGPADADTHEGLRVALGVIGRDGWESPAGRAVVAALQDRCANWASRRILDSHIGSGDLDPGEVLSVAWCTLATFTAYVAAAEAPWAYLWTSVHNTLAVEIAAGQVLSSHAVRRSRATWPQRAVRFGIGLDEDRPDVEGIGPLDEVDPTGGEDALSPSLAALVGHLAGRDGAGEAFWTDAVTRALDVMDGARLTYEHAALRADPYLRQVLGLAPQELSDLGALLVGPRRGKRAAQCLLLALRADPDADPATVDGALARIRRLTARRPVPATTGSPTAVGVAA